MLNMEMSQRRVIDTAAMPWQDSPADGVSRKPLEREARESGHTTSIVRYHPGARFASHRHPMGEEILVLDGVFSDEHGDYPAGTYLRNPPGSQHAPFSASGCTLLVKLNQFAAADDRTVRLNTRLAQWQPGLGELQVMPLHHYGCEQTALVKWPANEHFSHHRHIGGEEVLVLSGEFCDEHGRYPEGCWIRSPHLSEHQPFVIQPTLIWVKTGHLLTE